MNTHPPLHPSLAGRFKREAIRDAVILSLLTIALLIPFSGKAFHLDDPLFIWAARHIQKDPLDFYGFLVNWYGSPKAMSEVMMNPPFTSYFMAAGAYVVGWGERGMHLLFILPAVSLTLGIYFLAKKFTRLPLFAALAAMAAPVFIISGTTVMSDVMMLNFWCWALYLWMEGSERRSLSYLVISGLLIALAALTKYYAISLIPLLAVYSFLRGDKKSLWLPALVLPVLILLAYQWATLEYYGRGLLLNAAVYSVNKGTENFANNLERTVTGFAFMGGCFATVIFFSIFLWSRRTMVLWAIIAGAAFLVLLLAKGAEPLFFGVIKAGPWPMLQLAILFTAGISLMVLSIIDLLKHRDADSVLLFLWIAGTFVFASFVNWSNNGRSNLPMLPAVGILIARTMESRYRASTPGLRFFLPLAPALVLALLIAGADYTWANSTRSAAEYFSKTYTEKGGKVWFQGHWGFQYYMEEKGAKLVDFSKFTKLDLKIKDIFIIPLRNTSLQQMPVEYFKLIGSKKFPLSRYVTIMTFGRRRAGFYSAVYGPVPYLIGPAGDDVYLIYAPRDGA